MGPVLLALAFLLPAGTVGCRGRAQEDVYRQKMLNEIRVLEDQLYAADYENRVLADKLERARKRSGAGASPNSQSDREPRPGKALRDRLRSVDEAPDDPKAGKSGAQSDATPAAQDAIDDLDLDDLDIGDVDMGDLERGNAPTGTNRPSTPAEIETGSGLRRFDAFPETVPPAPPVDDNRRGSGFTPMPEADLPDPSFIPPPASPEPPSFEDIRGTPVIPGEIAPPPADDAQPETPPGQIRLDGLGAALGTPSPAPDRSATPPLVPSSLQLHPGFSGRHRFPKPPPIVTDALVPVAGNLASNREGMMLVINVLDQNGRIMPLDGFAVDAEMTVEAFPVDDDSGPLDTWKFTSDEVRVMVRSNPVSGFHVPVRWSTPESPRSNVEVRVRLQAGSEVMTCRGTLNVSKELSASRWVPREAPNSRR